MSKIITLSPSSTKWIYIMNGLINTAIGVQQLFREDPIISWSFILGWLLVIAGPIFILFGILLFNRSGRLTPKVQLDESGISIKEDIFKAQKVISWANIKEIVYGSFALNFHLKDNSTLTVNLETNSEISVDVKKTIRRYASEKNIVVVGG